MSAQMRYGFSTPKGGAGGIYDLAPYAIDTFINEGKTGAIKPGMGVVKGTVAGKYVKLPATGDTAVKFEGVVVNNRTTEHDLEGKVAIKENAAVGVMRYGRIYARLANGVEPSYGDNVYLIVTGDEAGCFTNSADGNVAIKARFLGTKDATASIAEIELFNQAQA